MPFCDFVPSEAAEGMGGSDVLPTSAEQLGQMRSLSEIGLPQYLQVAIVLICSVWESLFYTFVYVVGDEGSSFMLNGQLGG